MYLRIYPTNNLMGEIEAPPSKSYSHRVFFAACLANTPSTILNPIDQGDVSITINSLRYLGAKIIKQNGNNTYFIEKGIDFDTNEKICIDCKNSGTTVRFLTALSIIFKGELQLYGEFFKRKRPIKQLLESIKSFGIDYVLSNNSLKISRRKSFSECIRIPGNISSQFISSLLFICPLIKSHQYDHIEIEVSTPIVSYPYIKISLEVLNAFGIKIIEKEKKPGFMTYWIPLNQEYIGNNYEIPGDFSSIAFIIAAIVLSPEDSLIKINNLDFIKPQGDEKIIEILKKMGAQIQKDLFSNSLSIKGNLSKYPLTGIEIDMKDIPDLFPILAVIGIYAKGLTKLYNASNLRLKETDRIKLISECLANMGVNVIETENGIVVSHANDVKGTIIKHNDDHRIAMALIIASLYANSSSEINNAEIVKDSYPNFINDLLKLGAKLKFHKN